MSDPPAAAGRSSDEGGSRTAPDRVHDAALPVARVAVDIPLPHLDRPFDYRVPDELSAGAVPGARVTVRLAGRRVSGYVLERLDASAFTGTLHPLLRVVSAEPVLDPEIAQLARRVADRYAGTLADVLRLAVPPRHARVEQEIPPAAPAPAGATAHSAGTLPAASVVPVGPTGWERYPGADAFLDGLAGGQAPRAVWWALPAAAWAEQLAEAAAVTAAAGRGVLIVVPDGRDAARVGAAVTARVPHTAVLTADLGPAQRYRRWLAIRRGQARVVVGTRAAMFAPVHDLGLVAIWDDGDDNHKERRAPYPHARDVLLLRTWQQRCGLLVAGFAPSVEATGLVVTGWARPLAADRAVLRTVMPRIIAAGDEFEVARDEAARAARLPSLAFRVARTSLADGYPVLVQVPRRGYQPSLACVRCRNPARCGHCHGPLGRTASGAAPACRWCGRPAADWACPECGSRATRVSVVGARRTAEELGRAFPGVPVLTSGGDAVRDSVEHRAALVVATPGAEPVAARGYGAVLLLDGWALLSRPDLRAGEDALRRWTAAAALVRGPAPMPAPVAVAPGGPAQVVILAEAGLPVVQALIRWDPAGFARREASERSALGFPPLTRVAAVEGSEAAVTELLAAADLPPGAEVLGPVPVDDWSAGAAWSGEQAVGEGRLRALVRVARADGNALAAALAAAQGARSARRTTPPARVELDPLALL